jgi:hypothetical protein
MARTKQLNAYFNSYWHSLCKSPLISCCNLRWPFFLNRSCPRRYNVKPQYSSTPRSHIQSRGYKEFVRSIDSDDYVCGWFPSQNAQIVKEWLYMLIPSQFKHVCCWVYSTRITTNVRYFVSRGSNSLRSRKSAVVKGFKGFYSGCLLSFVVVSLPNIAPMIDTVINVYWKWMPRPSKMLTFQENSFK